jgi:DNA-binding SARP family transcriptional activator
MHRAVARRAEPIDWLVSAKHYALGDEADEAMRVLGSAASEALGTGAWGAAVQIVDLIPGTTPPPSVEVIKARALVSDGDTEGALALLATLDREQLTAEELGLVALTRAAAYHLDGQGALVTREICELAVETEVPSPVREVALAWREMLRANDGGRITGVVDSLRRLAVEQRESGLRYFAGVSLHNAANAELARGKYAEADRLAVEAEKELRETEDEFNIIRSSRAILAISLAERGEIDRALELSEVAAGDDAATADALAEAAYLQAVTGGTKRARSLLAKFDRGDSRWSREMSSRAQVCCARVALSLAEGNIQAALEAGDALAEIEAADVDSASRLAVIRATLAVLTRSGDAREASQRAMDVTASQDAWRWIARARILEAIGTQDGTGLSLWIAEAEEKSCLALLELADAVAMSLGLLSTVPEALERSVIRFPERWMESLRRQVQVLPQGEAAPAAAMLAKFGTMEDARILREFDVTPKGRKKRTGLTARLVRRVSPTVRVHDLGSTSYEIGSRRIELSSTRRKAAALLLYLVTRPELTATREQVMENLWPDQSPKSAMNSLHQTLFFLRRDIEPWYEDCTTADYVRMESEMVSLDTNMFQVDSVAFKRQTADIVATQSAMERGPELLRLYKGGFAPEFEYEEWAQEWRAQLHGSYLHLAHLTVRSFVGSGLYSKAVEILTPVVLLDPLAFELRSTLVACLAGVGAVDAAQSHYRSMASLYSRDMGVPAPSYEEVVGGLAR